MRIRSIRKGGVIVTALALATLAGMSTVAEQGHKESRSEHEGDHYKGDRKPSGHMVRLVEVSAERFKFEPSRIVVREGETILLAVTSKDVTHGIAIKDYGIDRKLKPDQTERILVTAKKSGKFHFHCSVRCGGGHNRMHGELVVLEEAGHHEDADPEGRQRDDKKHKPEDKPDHKGHPDEDEGESSGHHHD